MRARTTVMATWICAAAMGATTLGAQAPDTASAVADTIRALDRAWMVDASLRHDAEALGRYLAPEFTLVFRNGGLYDRAHELASARSGPAEPASVSYNLSEQRIRVYGAAAISTGLFAVTSNGRTLAPARYTNMYVRRGGAWQVVASQMTTVPPPG